MKESDEEECQLAPRKRRRLRAQDLEDANADAAVFSCVSAGRVPEGLSAGSQEAAEVSSCVSADRGPVGLSAGSKEAADPGDAETEEDTNIRDAAGARRGRELAKLKPGGTVVVTIGSRELIKKALRLFGRAPGQRRHDLVFYSGRGGMTAAFTRGDELGHSFFFKMLAPLARSGREGDSHLFSSCQDATVVFQYYQQLPTNERTRYVLIRPGRNCALYFDLEWLSASEDTSAEARLSALREQTMLALQRLGHPLPAPPHMEVLCLTRPADGGAWKNSFHVTFPEVFFESNGEFGMKLFVAEQLLSRADMSSSSSSSRLARPFHVDTAKEFYNYENNSKIAGCILDTSVYSRNRAWRLLGSHKPGEAACTVASRDGWLRHQHHDDDEAGPQPTLAQFLAHYPNHLSPTGCLLVSDSAEVSDPRRACEAKRPARVKLSRLARDWVCNRLESMLRAAGDPDSEVSVHSDPDLQQDNIIYRGKNGPRGRVCLVQKARGQQCVHRHNHFFLIYCVQWAWYFCHSRLCRKTDGTYVRFFLGELFPPVPAAQPVLAPAETDKPQGRAGAAGPELASDIERELRQQLESPDTRFLKQKLLAGCEYSADYVQHVHKNLKQVEVKGQPSLHACGRLPATRSPWHHARSPGAKERSSCLGRSRGEKGSNESKKLRTRAKAKAKAPGARATDSSAGAPESETETDDATAEEESDAPATQAKKRDLFTRDLCTLLCSHCKEGSWTYELDNYGFWQQN
eukprot:g73211.t1